MTTEKEILAKRQVTDLGGNTSRMTLVSSTDGTERWSVECENFQFTANRSTDPRAGERIWQITLSPDGYDIESLLKTACWLKERLDWSTQAILEEQEKLRSKSEGETWIYYKPQDVTLDLEKFYTPYESKIE